MQKELVDLQRNSSACAIVKTSEYKTLGNIVSIDANVSDKFLIGGEVPPFAEKLDAVSKKAELCYFVIKDIDAVPADVQERFVGLVKDREFYGYNLPKNCIVVFTVKDKESLKKISAELYGFAAVAI